VKVADDADVRRIVAATGRGDDDPATAGAVDARDECAGCAAGARREQRD
jgi:hypothetical protein